MTKSEEKENEKNIDSYYKEMYEREQKKNEELTRKIVALEAQNADLNYKLDKVRKSKLWRAIYPVRLLWSHIRNLFTRLKSYGNIKNVVLKVKSKLIERKAYKSYGTLSFPSEEERKKQNGTQFRRNIKFSILVPLYNTPEQFLREMIGSVQAQTYRNFELCLADGSDGEHGDVERICKEYADKDSRIIYKKLERNEGISGNTNECIKLATGEYIGLFDHDDILHPSALFEYMRVIEKEDADYIYCDEATFKDGDINKMVTLHFKPDFAIDNLRANNYICHFSVFSRELIDREEAERALSNPSEKGASGTEIFRSEYDGSQDHDMILRLTAAAKKIVHVPQILYYWRSHAGSVASDIGAKTYAIDAAKRAVATHLSSCGFEGFEIESSRAFQTIFRIRYKLPEKPLISILIPNKDHITDLKRCIESILEKTSYENYEIIVIENNSQTPEIREYYGSLEKLPNVRVVEYKNPRGEFNYSRINNFGETFAQGKYLVLLNNDTEVVTRTWLEELLMYAQREDVGAVGCMLYYEDYSIQHAGIVIGLGAHRTAGHTHYRLPKDNLGYMGRLCYAQNVSAVTGACLMTKRELYEEVGGLSEEFRVALNDVDFCLRLRRKGLLNVFTPYAELFHYESRSRGSDVEAAEQEKAERYNKEAALFRTKWREELEQGDPYFNPNFSLDHSNFVLKGSPKGMLD